MKITEFDIKGPKLIEPRVFGDERGFFTERYRADLFAEIGVPTQFVQDNYSRSAANVLRGLHFQYDKPQAKLVTATQGRVLDVIVDIRRQSPTFGHSLQVELNSAKPAWLWVPAGFAHGFLVLSPEGADLMYKVDCYYNPKGEGGIRWNDPDLRIDWPVREPELSARDSALSTWTEYCQAPRF
jgi:dTDP-4-dehydrorhamnose 3,5-epimerase